MNADDTFDNFIIDSGLSDYYKTEPDLELRLYHDLGIYGDIAESCIEILKDSYNVDVSSLNFDDYFPAEFSGQNQFQKILFSFIPFLQSKTGNKRNFKPLTFLMISNALKTGTLE
ncbi:MAG: hypothetical protein ACI8WB_001224 [Phenylobacterium sp.]|jgi:hypothetical protein